VKELSLRVNGREDVSGVRGNGVVISERTNLRAKNL